MISNKTCLIIKNDGLGDLVLSSGLITEIANSFNGEVDLLTCKENGEIAENIEGVENIFYVSRDSLRYIPILWRFGIYVPHISRSEKKQLNILKRKKYYSAICLRRFIRQSTFIIMKYVNAENKYCFWQFPTNINIISAQHLSRNWKHIIGNLNVKSELLYYQGLIEDIFKMKVDSTSRLMIKNDNKYLLEHKLVGIGISGSSTNWKTEYWVELCNILNLEGYRILLFGGKNVEHISNKINRNINNNLENYVGKISFIESIKHLKRVSIYIGNDTGFSHFASLLVSKKIIIMGGGTFGRFFPWPTSTNQHLLFNKLDCFDCGWNCKYKEKYCLNLIYPKDVFSWMEKVIYDNNASQNKNLQRKPKRFETITFGNLPTSRLFLKNIIKRIIK